MKTKCLIIRLTRTLKGFYVKKVVNESFDNKRQLYKDQIKSPKEKIDFLSKKLDEKLNQKKNQPIGWFCVII